MEFLLLAMPTPALGLFPWSVLLTPEADPGLVQLSLINLSNVIVVLMLLFLAWPLTFFGSRRPESQIKVGLLRAYLRGPASAILALVIILNMGPATEVLGLPGAGIHALRSGRGAATVAMVHSSLPAKG